MAVIRLIEVVALVGLGWFILAQLVLPVLKGDPIMPMFWTMADKLEVEKAKLEQQLRDKQAANEVETLRERLHQDEQTNTKGNE